jgi:hypothetical protein
MMQSHSVTQLRHAMTHGHYRRMRAGDLLTGLVLGMALGMALGTIITLACLRLDELTHSSARAVVSERTCIEAMLR